MKTTARSVLLLASALLLTSALARANADMLVRVEFDDGAGNSNLVNSGTIGGTFAAANANFGFSASVPPTKTGGFAGDFWDGASSRSAISLPNSSSLQNLSSFTITGWINGFPTTAPTSPFLVDNQMATTGFSLQVISSNPRLRLTVDGVSVDTPNGSMPNNQWVFFAVTYDGTLAANNVNFYLGDGTTLSQSGSTLTLNQGSVDAIVGDLFIGRSRVGSAAAADMLDDVRIYGVQSGSGGVLDASALHAVMVPEPSSAGLILLGWALYSAGRRVLGSNQ
jgi:hypothetical protein